MTEDETVAAVKNGAVVNASGYKDQLKRQYGLVGLAGIALTVDNAWIALGSSISVSIGMCNHDQESPQEQSLCFSQWGCQRGLRCNDIDDLC